MFFRWEKHLKWNEENPADAQNMYNGCIQNNSNWVRIKKLALDLLFILCAQECSGTFCSTRLHCSSQTAYYISKEVKVNHWSAATVCLCLCVRAGLRRQFFLPVTGVCTCQGSVKAFMELWINNCRVSETIEIFHEYYMRLSGRQTGKLTLPSVLTN